MTCLCNLYHGSNIMLLMAKITYLEVTVKHIHTTVNNDHFIFFVPHVRLVKILSNT